MARILITSGPTRQYLDPVRYITNGSSGRMGAELAQAAMDLGHDVIVISGPVSLDYPGGVKVVPVITTDEMLEAALEHFQTCDGAIGAAAPCDYMPRKVLTSKMSKNGQPLTIELIETADVIATLGQDKRKDHPTKPDQWVVGFALETEDQRFRAIVKLEKKHCDLMVSNGPSAIDALDNQVELLDPLGNVIDYIEGSKRQVATRLMKHINDQLMRANQHEH